MPTTSHVRIPSGLPSLSDLLDATKHSPAQRRATELARSDYQLKADLIAQRVAAGLTQMDVAKLLGLTQPTVADFERYDSDPKLSTIRRYAHAIGALVHHSVRADIGDLAEGQRWHAVAFRVELPVSSGDRNEKRTYAAKSKRLDFSLAA